MITMYTLINFFKIRRQLTQSLHVSLYHTKLKLLILIPYTTNPARVTSDHLNVPLAYTLEVEIWFHRQ